MPVTDVAAALVPATPGQDAATPDGLVHPGIPFAAHSTPGTALTMQVDGVTCAPDRVHDRVRLQGQGDLVVAERWPRHRVELSRPAAGRDAADGLVAFYDELVDVTIDGVARPRPAGPFSRVLREEFDL